MYRSNGSEREAEGVEKRPMNPSTKRVGLAVVFFFSSSFLIYKVVEEEGERVGDNGVDN